MTHLPVIGITLGEPAGIGSEITAKLFRNHDLMTICKPVVIGDIHVLREGIRLAGSSSEIHEVSEQELPWFNPVQGTIPLLNIDNMKPEPIQYGQVRADYGKAAGEYIEKAIQLCLGKKLDAMVTNPIHKDSFKLGGYGQKYPGHTEMCAALTGTKKYSMMLAHGSLRVIHVTTHIPFKDILKYIKKENILEKIHLAWTTCLQLGIQNPRVAVAGINPHAGDGGIFGTEEIDEILPAVQMAKKEGINAIGPLPADSVFARANGGSYDIVVAMYHDQGHTPVKTLGFIWNEEAKAYKSVEGINVTLGLPIIRSSVDHGTAFGKAGKGLANENSLYSALKYAVDFARSSRGAETAETCRG